MAAVRLGLAQVRLTVGDLAANAATVRRVSAEAADAGCTVVCFPEMTLTGYPPEDLVLRTAFQDASLRCLDELVGQVPPELAVVVGLLGRDRDGRPQNQAAVLHGGRVAAVYAKHHLPNYGVFDEARYFSRGQTFPVVRLAEVDLGLVICEDLWAPAGPVAVARAAGVSLLVCLNGSPYERGKGHVRAELVGTRAREAGCPIGYVNQVGGQDELVFDGQSFVVDAAGTLVARGRQFCEELRVVALDVAPGVGSATGDLDAGGGTTLEVTRVQLAGGPAARGPAAPTVEPAIAQVLGPEEEVYRAVVLGTRDYVAKNGFTTVCLGLSGGIDSALVATIAVDALGADRVHTVAMPSAYSSQHSLDDAADLARRQGTRHQVIPIAPVVEAFHGALAAGGGLHGLAEENLQARVRGTLLMALSNEHGHLVLTTGNKSELATGFSTLYGDSAGGFAPIKDVPKTWVWRLARWRNSQAGEPIPPQSITKPPSAELSPGQLDSDRLPDYDELDAVLDAYVEGDLGRAQLLAAGFAPATVDRVVRLVDSAEYKRRQNPPGPKITSKAFGRDRRLPITSRWREDTASSG